MNYDFLLHFTPVIQIVAGLLLLSLGRKLFWLFVGIIGFFAGLKYAPHLAQGLPQIAILVIAMGTGVVGAILALLMERIAIALAGAFAGGILAMHIAALLGITAAPAPMVVFAVGAILSAILVSVIFDWALIALSAITGTYMVAEALPLNQNFKWFAGAALCIFGIFFQARLLRRAKTEE